MKAALRFLPYVLCLALPDALEAAESPQAADGIRFSGALTVGTAVRTASRDPALLPNANSSQIGVTGTAPVGRNQDDGNLNFDRGDTVSTVAKGYVDMEAGRDSVRFFSRIKFWHDFLLAEHGMPWGNHPNNHGAGAPLGQDGFPSRARFSGVALEDAYLGGEFRPWDKVVQVKLGRQTLPWGQGFAIGGGTADLNPLDVAAQRRPGALPEEGQITMPLAFARLEFTPRTAVEAFSQFAFQPSVQVPCGTFYSGIDYLTPGCNPLWVGGTNDRNPVGYRSRAPDVATADGGQYGFAFHYRFEPWATRFSLIAAQYHSRNPYGSILKGAAPTSTQYYVEYPERIKLYSLQFTTRLENTLVQGAITHRPNQPLQLSGADLVLAFATPSPYSDAALLRANARSTPAGAAYAGYDRYAVSQVQVAANRKMAGILGAASGEIAGEIGFKHVHGLPDPRVRRYGRSEVFGYGPVPWVSCTGTAIACTDAGYVSANSWGYRLRAQLSYTGWISSVTLSPSLALGHDVKGWSPDGLFIEGRKLARIALRADTKSGQFAELAWQTTWGAIYDNLRDRDAASLVVGTRF